MEAVLDVIFTPRALRS